MALLPNQAMTRTGLAVAFGAVSASDTLAVPQGERTFLHVKNGGAVATNVTLVAVITALKIANVGAVTIANQVIAIPAGAERMIGPIPPAFVNDAGLATVNFSAQATVTAAAVTMPPDST